MQIHIIEKESRLIRAMSTEASERQRNFKAVRVNIWLNTAVTFYDGKFLGLANGKQIVSYAVIWTSGVRGRLSGDQRKAIVNDSRYSTDHFNRIEGMRISLPLETLRHDDAKHPNGHPMVAPVAVQQGKLLSRNL